jgi:hypothetical protein
VSASKLYQSFRGRKADRAVHVGVRFGSRWITAPGDSNLLIPASLAVIGHVAALEYDSTRDGKTVLARHEFKKGSRPLFAVGDQPGQLFLVGESYKFTSRGIVDL